LGPSLLSTQPDSGGGFFYFMNIKLQRYKRNRIKGMNIVNSAIAAGYSENYARKKAFRIERQVKVGLNDAFERAGLTDKAIVEHALEGLNADKVISCNVISPDGGSMRDAHGTTKDFIDVPDWPTRHKYFETILKLSGRLNQLVDGAQVKNEFKIMVVYPNANVQINEQVNNRIEVIPNENRTQTISS